MTRGLKIGIGAWTLSLGSLFLTYGETPSNPPKVPVLVEDTFDSVAMEEQDIEQGVAPEAVNQEIDSSINKSDSLAGSASAGESRGSESSNVASDKAEVIKIDLPTVLILPPIWWADPEATPDDLPPETVFKLAVRDLGYNVLEAPHQENCFSERCIVGMAKQKQAALVLFSAFIREDTLLTIKVGLYDTVTHTIRAARETWITGPGLPRVKLLHAIVADLLAGRGQIEGGTFDELLWLRARPERESSRMWVFAAPTLGTVGAVFMLFQGQLLQRDHNSSRPSRPLLNIDGAQSFLPGIFSGFTPSPRIATLGGAGSALAIGAEALTLNPAGVASGLHPDLQLSRSALPDGTPEFTAALAFPTGPGWSQGYALLYRGDALADETIIQWGLAADLGWWSPVLKGWRVGLAPKLLLAKVGEGGNGLERSTGHSVGSSFDVGTRIRLSSRIEAAIVMKDPISFVWHRNTFTDETYTEILPPRLRIGAACLPLPGLILVLDGDKALVADQADHVRMGIESTVFQILRLRGGIHEAFGRETISKASLGFGVSNAGMQGQTGGYTLQIDYGLEFGIDVSGVLAGGHRFGLRAGF